MIKAPPVCILRHGQTVWNLEGRLQGRLDSPLTPAGRAQARTQNRILRGLDVTGFAAISSPQGRALRTAEIALDGVIAPIQTDMALSEIGIGDWAGQDRAALMASIGAVDGFALYDLAPGGEGLIRLHARCTAFVRRLQGPTVIVTHGITSRMLRLVLTGRPAEDVRDIGGGQGNVYHVARGMQRMLE